MKKIKNLLLLIPALLVGVAAMRGFSQSQPVMEAITFPQVVEAADKKETEEENKDKKIKASDKNEVVAGKGNYKDGAYEGIGMGYSGEVKVKVTVKKKQIVSVEIIRNKDDAAFFNRAKQLISNIIKSQTWEVDSISGATYSSRGIREAVRNALSGSKSISNPAKKNNAKKKVKKTSYKGAADWKDGTYKGSAQGYGGTIQVKVIIKDGKIDKIQVSSHKGETGSYYDKAKSIIQKILKKQSPNVDTISGATYSSSGIKNAVIDALKKAETKKTNKKETADDKKEEKPGASIGDSTQEKPTEGSTIKDGTYHVSAECIPDEYEDFEAYTISCDVTFKKQKLISMSNFTSTDESNKIYYTRAAKGWGSRKGVIDQLIARQSAASIQAVSGATCSSVTIRKLYQEALKQAIGEEKKEEKPDTSDKEEIKPDLPDAGETKPDLPKDEETSPNPPDAEEESKPDEEEAEKENKPDEEEAEKENPEKEQGEMKCTAEK